MNMLLRQRSGAFDALGICRAIFGEPAVAGCRERSSETGIVQSGKRAGQAGAKQDRNINPLAVHVDKTRSGIGHARTARMRTVIRSADADSQAARPRPSFPFDDCSELAIATRPPFRRPALIFVRQALLPIDMVFF